MQPESQQEPTVASSLSPVQSSAVKLVQEKSQHGPTAVSSWSPVQSSAVKLVLQPESGHIGCHDSTSASFANATRTVLTAAEGVHSLTSVIATPSSAILLSQRHVDGARAFSASERLAEKMALSRVDLFSAPPEGTRHAMGVFLSHQF